MIAQAQSARFQRRLSPFAAVGMSLAVLFVSFRLLEDPGNPATTFRILMSVTAIAFVLFARKQTLVQRATVFIALEALGGFVAFTYVDVPFIVSHAAQIQHLAVSLARDIQRFQ